MFKFGCCTTDEELVICDTQLLAIKRSTKRTYLSVAVHAVSGDVLGWNLSDCCAAYQSLQYAIHASLANWRHCGEKKPYYIVDSGVDSRRIVHALNDINLDVTLYNSMSIEQHAKVERFFREYNRYIIHMTDDRNIAKENTMKLAALRKQFEEWLKIFQQGPNARVLDNRRSGQKPLQKSYLSGGHNHMRKHK
jgi:hypothetical protein